MAVLGCYVVILGSLCCSVAYCAKVDSKKCTSAHNKYRGMHKAPDLKWDSEIASVAQAFANKMGHKDVDIKHSVNSAFGENLSMAPETSCDLSCAEATKAWYSEKALYDYSKPSYSPIYERFTQLVWKGSTKFGCGISCSGKKSLLVCNYSPAGNSGDEKTFLSNVLVEVDN